MSKREEAMSPPSDQSHLFSLRVWKAHGADDEPEYRGQIHHVLSGEIRHFRSWDTLTAFIVGQVEQNEALGGDLGGDVDEAGAPPDQRNDV